MDLSKVKYFRWENPDPTQWEDSDFPIENLSTNYLIQPEQMHTFDFPTGKTHIKTGDLIYKKSDGQFCLSVTFLNEDTILCRNERFIENCANKFVMFMFAYVRTNGELTQIFYFDGKGYGWL